MGAEPTQMQPLNTHERTYLQAGKGSWEESEDMNGAWQSITVQKSPATYIYHL